MQHATPRPSRISLRARVPSDSAFLRALYASTRAAELAQVPWSDEQKQAFCVWQYEAQTRHYDDAYHAAEFSIIEREGSPIGRLYVYRDDPSDVRIVDIGLVPEVTGQGIGGALIREVIAAANLVGKSVSIHVEQNNPALRLYERLGFRSVGEFGVYLLMRRPAG